MKVLYLPIEVYEDKKSSGNPVLSNSQFRFRTIMPYVVAESAEEFNSIPSYSRSEYITLATLKERVNSLPFDYHNIVVPGFFGTTESIVGFFTPEFLDAQPVMNYPDSPISKEYSGRYFAYIKSAKMFFTLVSGTYLQQNGHSASSETGQNFGNSFRSFGTNNTASTRMTIYLSILECIDGYYTGRCKDLCIYSGAILGNESQCYSLSYTLGAQVTYALNTNIEPQPGPTPPTPSGDDPYGPDSGGPGYSGSGGGPAGPGGTGATGTGGLHDDSSDTIPTPSLPSDVATASGLFTAYNPSPNQLANFGTALWSMNIEDIDDVLRFLVGGDAFNAIIGLHLLPVQPVTGNSPNIKLGKWDSGVSAPKITNQYVQVSFGSVLLPEYWGNSIDYSPYTKVQLALPYIGIVDVETDDVLGSNNTLVYNIDVLSGAICATLHCVKGNLNSVIYQWSGSCAVTLPITGASYNGVLSSVLAIAAGAATIAVGGATIAGASGAGAALAATKGGAAIAGGLGTIAGSALNTFGSVKGKVQKSGAFGANSGALGIMTPYFIVTRPVQSVPETWQAEKGYPANISAQLGNLTGYTEVSEINLECSGTEAEKEEIIRLLKSGVIF